MGDSFRQLEAARVVALPILLSKFAKQYSDPLPEQLNLGIGAPKPETELSPLAILTGNGNGGATAPEISDFWRQKPDPETE